MLEPRNLRPAWKKRETERDGARQRWKEREREHVHACERE